MADDKFALSVRITSIEKPQDLKKDTNYKCKISIETTHGSWTLDRTFKEFEIFHANLLIADAFRGVNFPKMPARKGSVASIDEYLGIKQNEYTQYLSEILHRSILLGSKDILDFIQAPEKVRRAAKRIMELENIPVRAGQMKKEGEKWKGYRSRYFVLLPNYLLQYFETADAYQIGIQPKGSIDLTLATKILVYDKTSNPYSMGIKTPTRIWKLQSDTESDRDEWVQSLRNLLQNPQHTGYIQDYHEYSASGKLKSNSKNTSNDTAQQGIVANGYHHDDDAVANAEDDDMNDTHYEEMKIENESERKMKEELTAQQSAMEEQDKQILELQQRMQSLISRQTMQTEQLKDEIAMEYKQQLDIQRETMVKWKEKIQELSTEIVNIEQERKDADQEHKNKIDKLNKEIAALRQVNEEQKKSIQEKDDVISKTQDSVREMSLAVNKLQKDAEERKKKMYSISDVLYKVQGDAVSKLKYAKQSRKFVVFINKINHLFYYDDGANKGDSKSILINDVSINNNSIQSQMHKPWFLVIGDKRCALFAADSTEVRDKWVKFIRKSLGKAATAENEQEVPA
eukprot:CAMPEP_0197026392 /NCGR_PEP_ID=MMETSP1384-20130603/6488_1 /TAXON_ID=29189 /ORGANISM="Ammonia sp." /LENGTH=570 /DNA_ID=CAMNT_0042455045 /DNA_START=38 /DNA_END=1746 /DNA_ORIENTATION=+